MDEMRSGFDVTRRHLFQMGGAAILSASSLAGCSFLSTKPPSNVSGERRTPGVKGKEAPMLARLVEEGKLPPVGDRLPKNPVVVTPVDRLGAYGGTWHTAMLSSADTSWLWRTIGYEPLLRWTPDWKGSIPNVAESVTSSSDGLALTIKLRDGIRWSDGEPMTADDMVFYYEDVILNDALTPAVPTYFVSGDAPAQIEKLSELSVRLTFAKPNGLLLYYLSWLPLFVGNPRHYLADFHEKYNPKVADLVKEQNADSWVQLFLAKADPWSNVELPRLHAWKLTTALGDGARVIAERNPYYFKTDTDGSQLPYIDRVEYEVVSNIEVIVLKATNGELDFHTRHFNTPPNKPVLARGREAGGFKFNDLTPAYENEMVIALNLTHEDPVKREIFQNRDFRIGLSYAINRPELIDAVYQAQAEPWQAAPRRESEFFDEEFAKQYTEYDVDKANQHLDRAGYAERDGGGFRLGPDGKRISFAVEVATPAVIPFWNDGMQFVVGYWKKVGIDAQVKPESRDLFTVRTAANKHDAAVWTGFGGLTVNAIMYPGWYFPYDSGGSWFAVNWANWFSSRGKSGEEPPDGPRRQMELYRELLETPQEGRRNEMFREILEITKQEFYVLGTLNARGYYGIVKNDFHNVPTTMPESDMVNTPAVSNPEQYFVGD